MADMRNEKTIIGKIEFWRNNVIGRTPLSIIFKGTFEGRIEVAVKRISLDLAKLAENEIDVLLAKADHENIVKYHCKEEDRDYCYIAMQLCPCNLEEYVEKKGNYLRDGLGLSLPNTPIEEILRGAAEGLAHIHKKDIIHRDIKPSNILLFVKENKLVAKISDFGISRFIPDHHTVPANFSAGTDLYKAPELLTPPFSWRSDACAFGLVVFYVLSEGKHLFNNNLGQIIKGNPVNLSELNKQPAALSLVKWLTAFSQEERPRMSEVVHHPFFWNDKKKLNFIRDFQQIAEDKQNALLIKEVIEEESHHVVCSSPENCGNQRTPPDPAVCADWTRHLKDVVKSDFRGKVKTESCADLTRIIRNKLTHFYDLKEAVKAEYGGSIEGFRRYWMERFPSLIIHLWEKVEITHLAALFRGYYAPESVRRRNVETTLLRAVDEGDLGKLQELQNKIKRLGSTIWERALRSAVDKGRKELVEVLLKDGTGPDVGYKDLINSLLHKAAGDGLVEIAQLLIERGAEVNCKNQHGWTPLHYAADNGHSAVAQLLIERGAKVNCKNQYGSTLLRRAPISGETAVAQLLIERGTEVNCKDENGETPLHLAACHDHSAVAQLLIERGAEVNCRNEGGVTPLRLAAEYGHSAIAKLLIERDAEVNCKDIYGGTPLHYSAKHGHSEVAKLLIKHDAEINCKNRFGETPLHLAASHDNSAIAELLIEHDAEVNCKNEDVEAPLHLATRNGHSAVAQLLIERGAEVHCKNQHGWTPLYLAADKGHSAVAKLLIERGAEVNCKGEYGWTPLHLFAHNGHSAIAKLLIERGAEVNCKHKYGWTPLHLAAEYGHSAFAQLLIEHDAEVNCKSKNGWTPLHFAARYGRSAIAKLLIERDAEVNCENEFGRTPLDYAVEESHTKLIDLLRNPPARKPSL